MVKNITNNDSKKPIQKTNTDSNNTKPKIKNPKKLSEIDQIKLGIINSEIDILKRFNVLKSSKNLNKTKHLEEIKEATQRQVKLNPNDTELLQLNGAIIEKANQILTTESHKTNTIDTPLPSLKPTTDTDGQAFIDKHNTRNSEKETS